MIPRYTGKKMGDIWTDDSRYGIWLDIEILACEAMNKLGTIPDADLARIQKRAKFNSERILEIEAEVHHDVIAFLTNVAEYVGPSSRYIHRGLTSSDILDTALSVQMVRAADILIEDHAIAEVIGKAFCGVEGHVYSRPPVLVSFVCAMQHKLGDAFS